MTKKEVKSSVKYISSQVESGIEELGKNEGLIIESNTFFKEKKGVMPQSVFVLQQFAKVFSQNITLSSASYRIFFHLIALTEYENFISVDIKTIAQNLNLSERTVIRGIKDLEAINIILKTAHINDKRRHEYFLNPTTVWKGNSQARTKKIRKINDDDRNVLQLPFDN